MVTRSVVLARVADLACVLVFAGVGRASHGEDVGPLGVLTTAWPFVLGGVAGWALTLGVPSARTRPTGVRAGVLVWVCTVVIGMAIRWITAAGVQASFVVVATIVLGVFLLGWRGVAGLVVRARRASRAGAQV